jgi:hypothetical protein
MRTGLRWGMFPDSPAAPHLGDGSFVRISEEHLDVPLFWQSWKLDCPLVKAVAAALTGDRGYPIVRGKSSLPAAHLRDRAGSCVPCVSPKSRTAGASQSTHTDDAQTDILDHPTLKSTDSPTWEQVGAPDGKEWG